MTNREIIDLRKLALRLTRDEDITQEILFEIIRQNLTFPLAVNYIKLVAKGSAYKLNARKNGKRTLDALNRPTLSLETTPQDADECTLEDIIPALEKDPTLKIDLDAFIETLNDKERTILNLILDGYTVREICKHLKISSKTYTRIISTIRQKALEYFE
jgi:DNA-directed RNA polymerase specialized sigma24 family protein